MLKLILRILFLIILWILAYEIHQTGSFNRSPVYRFLREKGVIEKGEVFLKEAKKSYDKAMVWAEKNIPIYYNETCFHLKPYLNLGKDLSLVFKSNMLSFIQNMGIYVDKNYPNFQNHMSVAFENTINAAKECALVLSQHLQNYAEIVIQYANNMFS